MNEQVTYQPPQLALRLFRWYCRPDRVEELEGDLEEFFNNRISGGESLRKAQLFYWWNVFRCYRSYAKSKTQTNTIMFSLLKSYFKLAVRHSWKNKWSVMINVVGLGIALSMCVFVYTLYAYNIEFDSFYKYTDNIYRLHAMTFENNQERRNEISPVPLDNILKNEISGVSKVGTFVDRGYTVKKGNEFFEESVSAASLEMIEMFNPPLRYGSFAEFGKQPVVYLTEPTAKKYFGDQVALGEKLTIYMTDEQKFEATVAGVFERIPLNSSFDFTMLIHIDDYIRTRDLDINDWNERQYFSHYIETNLGNVSTIEDNLNRYIPQQNEAHEAFKIQRFELVPFRSSLVTDENIWRSNANSRLRTTVHIIFTTLTAMVFLIACFNLANSSMAMIAKRLKEIGIRKTLGSESRQILGQFLFEMGIVSALAFVIAFSTVNLTSNAIMGLFEETWLVRDVDLTGVIIFVIIFLLFTTLVAGLLPAMYAWRFQPVAIMRKSVKLKGVNWLNKALTVAQYSFSIVVLSAGFTFSKNSDFLKELNLGYQTDGIIALDLGNPDHYGPMKQKIDQVPGVITAGTSNHLANFGRFSTRKTLEIDTSTYELRTYLIGEGYLDLMEVKLASGRKFIDGSEADRKQSVLVNQEFAKRYFEGNDPINKVIKVAGERRTIVGVVANIIDDVYEDSEFVPIAMMLDENVDFRHLVVKVTNGNLESVEGQLKEIWAGIIDQPYDGELQKDLSIGSAGRDTENLQKIFIAMAILGGFLSIVGIFSLAKLNVAKRIKEISIRKVLGASLRELLMTINRSFVIVLMIALVFGSVLGYFVADMVLGMIYKYYTDVSAFTSLLAGIFIVLLSMIMITSAILTPANANPVVGLREE